MRDVGSSEASAALGVAALVLWFAFPERPRSAPDCAVWSESRAVEVREGEWWTEVVSCGTKEVRRALRGPAPLVFGETLDLNRAEAATLETLPGVGAARAAAIVRSRRERPFESVEDLQRVHGIGPATVAKLAGWLHVSPRTGHSAGHRRLSAPEGGP